MAKLAFLWSVVVAGGVVGFPSRSWDDAATKARSVVANLTLSEKVGLVRGNGVLSGPCTGNLHAVTRLNISSICMQDGPAGLRGPDLVSGFPAGITTAATFNRDLMQQRGQAIGEEYRAKGTNVFLGPAMDVMRAPDAGRLWESFGADAYLTGEAVYATVKGVQSTGVQACAKHLIGNQQETFRFTESSMIDQRTLMEKYYLPFQRAIDADVACVMCSYNRVNGTYTCSEPSLVGSSGIVKGFSGFRGYVVSDWGATHGDAADLANAGLDVEMPGDWILIGGGVYFGLEGAVNSGAVSQATLDTMVTHTLTSYYFLGQDSGFPSTNYNVQSASKDQHVNVRSAAHTKLVRDIANAAAILLKNTNNALPLSQPATLAVIGLDAAAANTGCSLNACDDGTLSIGWGSGTNSLAYLVPPITALQTQVAAQGNHTVIISSITNDKNKAVAAAKGAAVAVVFVNSDSGEFQPIPVNWSTGDRTDQNLWNDGDGLITAVAAVNKNTVVVIHTVGPNILEKWINNPNVTAVIVAGLPGEQSGPSIVDVLYGNVNPSGRLPYTIAKQSSDYPAHTLQFSFDLTPDITYAEGLFTDYMYFDSKSITPRFEFGFGLSYNFGAEYSDLTVSSSSVSVTLKNTGSRAGTEIAQLYIGFPAAAGEPPKVLRGFEAVALDVGEQKTVSFALTPKDISVWDATQGTFVRPAGTFTVFVGSSSRDIRLTDNF